LPRWHTVEDDHHPICDECSAFARWAICNLEGGALQPITRWFACGNHLNRVLTEADWDVDQVVVLDLTGRHS